MYMLLTVENRHVASCGIPPALDVTKSETRYVGYFMNALGEQWLFIGNPDGSAIVCGGDARWDTEFPVVDGVAQGLVVNGDEALWIRACWIANGRRQTANGSNRLGTAVNQE